MITENLSYGVKMAHKELELSMIEGEEHLELAVKTLNKECYDLLKAILLQF